MKQTYIAISSFAIYADIFLIPATLTGESLFFMHLLPGPSSGTLPKNQSVLLLFD